ncbi:glutathione S-transferase family protein [Marinobacter sp. M216]|uniref:Glutathione S-transferase family protein n=1 Tax=Marinobacter albus TaxID=3030833 RepID=A0ABT7H700_9GAMM|nr:glutathione S-transferase family protein [Marinobacter sp. M216]MDK9556143.1 glutathione S-transferase family protein [Marinobacter sp. M216]
MQITLYDWGPSPFCLKVRAILDYKGIRYKRINVLGKGTLEVYRRGGIGKVPAIDIDGCFLADSTNIAHELDRLFPERRIIPPDSAEAALCHVLDDWADEALYFIGLYYQWMDPEGAPMLSKAFRGPVGKLVLPLYKRRLHAQIKGQGTGRKPPAMIKEDLLRELDTVEGLLNGKAFLLGATPALCDFSLMAQLVYMSRPPGSAREVTTRAAITEYLGRMRSLRKHGRNDS